MGYDLGGAKAMRAAAAVGLAISTMLSISTASGQQKNDCSDRLTENSPVKEIISCIRQQQEKIFELSKASPAASNPIPSGAVIAFALEDGCPSGWSNYDRAIGRSIIGVGQSEGLTNRLFLSQGGNESHNITVSQLPPHKFSTNGRGVVASSVDKYNAGGKNYYVVSAGAPVETETLGNGEAINIMDPYVALFFCKKG